MAGAAAGRLSRRHTAGEGGLRGRSRMAMALPASSVYWPFGTMRIHWDERRSAAGNARRELPALMAAYFARVRHLLAKDPPPAKLHRVRLVTKRIRYTLELFRPCYGRGLDARIAGLRDVQRLLGEVNDCVTAASLLSKGMRASPQKAHVKKFLDDRARLKAADFRRHWAEVFDAPGQERWWTGYLGTAARATAGVRNVTGRR